MKHFIAHSILVSAAVSILIGCATPEARIKKNPEVFAAFPPDVQEMVQKGEVDIGFNTDMAYIALGDPNRKYSRTTAEGVAEVWAYTAEYTTTERQRIDGRFRVRSKDGRYYTVYDDAWVDVPRYHEYDKLRLEMRDGLIVAIERLEK